MYIHTLVVYVRMCADRSHDIFVVCLRVCLNMCAFVSVCVCGGVFSIGVSATDFTEGPVSGKSSIAAFMTSRGADKPPILRVSGVSDGGCVGSGSSTGQSSIRAYNIDDVVDLCDSQEGGDAAGDGCDGADPGCDNDDEIAFIGLDADGNDCNDGNDDNDGGNGDSSAEVACSTVAVCGLNHTDDDDDGVVPPLPALPLRVAGTGTALSVAAVSVAVPDLLSTVPPPATTSAVTDPPVSRAATAPVAAASTGAGSASVLGSVGTGATARTTVPTASTRPSSANATVATTAAPSRRAGDAAVAKSVTAPATSAAAP